jgi:hypothetical protein
MQIIGRSSSFSNNAISSGLDSVTEGIIQSTESQGIATLDTAINTFSNVDPNQTNVLDQQTPVSTAGDFPDPSSFWEGQQVQDDVGKFINDPGFQPAFELKNFSNDFFPGFRGKITVPDQKKTLDDMQSTVSQLNDWQSDFDARIQLYQLADAGAVIPQDRSNEAQQSDQAQVELYLAAQIEPEKNDGVEFSASTKTHLGPILEGDVDADIGKNTYIDIGGEAFFGAKASAEGTAEVGEYGSVTGGAGVYAGLGAKGDVDLGIKDGKLKFNIGGGLALGFGFELDMGFDIDYEKIAEDLYNAGEEVMKEMEKVFNFFGGEVKNAGETAEETAEDVIEVIEDTAEDVVDGFGDVAEGAGDVIDDALDW